MAKILQLTQAAAEAKATVKKALAALASSPTDRAAMKAHETALRAKIAADDALAAAKDAAPAAKTTTTKHIKHEEKVTEREEDDADDAEEAAPPPPAKDDDADDDDSDSGSDADSSTGASAEYDADEKAIAKSYAAGGVEAGIYAPARLARLAKQVTGQKSIKAAFGALEGLAAKAAAYDALEARTAKLEARQRTERITALLASAQADGRVIGKAQADSLRSTAQTNGTKWLKGHLATLPKRGRTVAEGDAFEPRADADGNPLGSPTQDQQRMDATATAGMTPEQVAKYRANLAANLAKINGASRPTH